MFEKEKSEAVFAWLESAGCRTSQCGSQFTCSPPPGEASDWDFLVEIPQCPHQEQVIADVVNHLNAEGFVWEGGDHYQKLIGTSFMSFRLADGDNPKGGCNLLVTADSYFGEKHKLATFVCRHLNIMEKPKRIMLFQAILYGNQYDPSA